MGVRCSGCLANLGADPVMPMCQPCYERFMLLPIEQRIELTSKICVAEKLTELNQSIAEASRAVVDLIELTAKQVPPFRLN